MAEAEGPRGHRYRADFRERLRRGDTYGLLLTLILLSFVLMAAVEESRWSRLALSIVFGAMLMLALHTSHVRGRLVTVALILAVGIAVVSGVLAAISGNRDTAGATSYLIFVLLIVAPVVILLRIARHPVVNMETILGALCAYLMVGIIFSGVYRGFDLIHADGFFQQTQKASPVEFLYFSFVTLCTVGYGDLTPAHDGGRIVVIFEALIGQVFLVTIVAGLVGSFGRERRRSGGRDLEAADEGDG